MGLRRLGGFENLPTIDLMRDGEGTKTEVKLLSAKPNTGMYSKTVYTVEEGGEKKQFWGSTVLDMRLADAKSGDELTIVYLGKEPAKERGKQPFNNFDVFLTDPEYDGDDSKTLPEKATEPKKKVPF